LISATAGVETSIRYRLSKRRARAGITVAGEHPDRARITPAQRRWEESHRTGCAHLAKWNANAPAQEEIPFIVARIVLQDFTGVPLLVDLAAMRSALSRMHKDRNRSSRSCRSIS